VLQCPSNSLLFTRLWVIGMWLQHGKNTVNIFKKFILNINISSLKTAKCFYNISGAKQITRVLV